MADGFTLKSFDLLDELSENNRTEWMHDHKADWDAHLRDPFAALLETCTDRLKDTALPFRGSKSTMFRQNRDIRFSNDKRPYKEQVSGLLTPSGKKGQGAGLIYLHLDKEGGFIGAGLYELSTQQLGAIRDRMVADADAFITLAKDLDAAGLPLSDMNSLKGMPRGYADHADAPIAPFLKRKHLIVRRDLPKSAWLEGEVPDRVAEMADAAAPVVRFGQRALA